MENVVSWITLQAGKAAWLEKKPWLEMILGWNKTCVSVEGAWS